MMQGLEAQVVRHGHLDREHAFDLVFGSDSLNRGDESVRRDLVGLTLPVWLRSVQQPIKLAQRERLGRGSERIHDPVHEAWNIGVPRPDRDRAIRILPILDLDSLAAGLHARVCDLNSLGLPRARRCGPKFRSGGHVLWVRGAQFELPGATTPYALRADTACSCSVMSALLGCWCSGPKEPCSARAPPCRCKYFPAVSRSDRGRGLRTAGEGSPELGLDVRRALSPLLFPSARGRSFRPVVWGGPEGASSQAPP